MSSVKVVLRSRPNKDGLHPLQLRITKNQRSIRINIHEAIQENKWDKVAKRVKRSHPNSKRLNHYIDSRIIEVKNLIMDLISKHDDFTLEMVRSKILKTNDGETVFTFSDSYFDDLLLAQKFNRYSGERAAINHLKKFRRNRDLVFEDLNIITLSKYKTYLLGEVKVSERSAVNYLITIRGIYNKAIQAGLVDRIHYPFGKGGISCKRPESEKIGLDDWEVMLIENIKLEKGSFIDHTRNVWLFSLYFAGMRASDVLTLTWDKFKNERLFYTMGKNLKSDSVKISEKAKPIIKKYKGKEHPHNLVFPDLSNVISMKDKIEVQKKLKYRIRKLDSALRDIRDELNLKKDLTMHIARHSFGNIAGDKIPIQRLQQLYRHSSIITTINYQKAFLYKGADDALDEVLNF